MHMAITHEANVVVQNQQIIDNVFSQCFPKAGSNAEEAAPNREKVPGALVQIEYFHTLN